MAPRIAFMGAGAIGSYLGAFLSRAGLEPVLIDAWAEHVEAMKAGGLKVTGAGGDFTTPVKAMHLGEVQAVKQPFDIIFLALKSYDTEWGATFARNYLAPDGFVISSQNSINDELIARIVGYERVLGCTISTITAGMVGPGHVFRSGTTGRERGYDIFRAGEMNGMVTPRVQLVASLLDNVDTSRVTTNLWGERWAKLASNSMGNTLTAMAGVGAGDLMRKAPRFPVLRDSVAQETARVGLALGVSVEHIGNRTAEEWRDVDLSSPDPGPVIEDEAPQPPNATPAWPTSTLQDVLKGRKTEVEYLNGYVSAKGRQAGVPTPVNDAIVSVLKRVDSGELRPDPANVDLVWEAVHGK